MDIKVWLSAIGLEQYASAFEINAIDFETLQLLTDEDLRELEVTALGHRKKILAAISRINAEVDPEPSSGTPDSPLALPTKEGERREVTVLFADISGYTKLSTTMDAEETSELLNRYFKSVDEVVKSFGGTIDKHIGDAVMAVFGAPIAHSNDPERAIRSALNIHQVVAKIDPPITVHIGIASGQVVATDIGSESHQEYTITGDTVNLASRLQDMAKSGETFISNAVYQGLAEQLDCKEIGDVSVKGLAQPIKIWRLNKFRATGDIKKRHAFVGRKREIKQFCSAIEDCIETDQGQTIYIRGEAGIGKTRLIDEFENIANAKGFSCHKSVVLDFGAGKGQDAVRMLMRKLLNIPVNSDDMTCREAASAAIANGLIPADQEVYLYDLLDLPQPTKLHAVYDAMDNINRNRGKLETVTGLVSKISKKAPLILSIEDIHWADQIVLAHVGSLAEMVANHSILLILTGRMEGDPIEQNWRSLAPSAPLLTMDINPLREDEALSLAGEFFEVTSRFASSCIERAGGNPMFLEQLLRSAEESSEENVPGSVQSIVLSRVDNLDPIAKKAVQAASIIGQHFPMELLRHLIDDEHYTCADLVDHMLIRPMDGEYHFAHALIRDGIYSSLLNSKKRELHLKASEWFSDRDRALFAQHLDRAESPDAASAYAEAALAYAKLFRFEKASELVRRGKEIADKPEILYRLLMIEGECLRESGQPSDSIEVYRQALEATDDKISHCRAWIGLAAGMRVTDDYDEAFEALRQAEDVALPNQLDKELSEIYYYRGSLYFPLANLDGCLDQHQKALQSAERAGLQEHEARALSGIADAYYAQGKIFLALEYFRRCIELSRTHGFGRIAVGNAYMVPWNMIYLTEMIAARDDALAAVSAAVQAGHQRAEMVARLTIARIFLELGELDKAEEHVDMGLKLAKHLGAHRFEPFLLIQKVRAQFLRDGSQLGTVRMIEDALRISRETGIGFLGPWVLGTLALVHPDEKASRSALTEGELLLADDCVGHNYYDFFRDAMEVSLRLEDWEETERYAKGLELYTETDPLPWSDFSINRARALARHGKGEKDTENRERLQRLAKQAEAASMAVAKQALDAALAE